MANGGRKVDQAAPYIPGGKDAKKGRKRTMDPAAAMLQQARGALGVSKKKSGKKKGK